MFSGIVEEAAQVVALNADQGNLHITMKCSFVNELKIDQSVAHNGDSYSGNIRPFEPGFAESG